MPVTTETRRINTKQLLIDQMYQRHLNKSKVTKIVKEFDPLLVNPVKCSFRDGKYYVFDGQHTIAALKLRNKGKDLDVVCTVFYGLTQADEAHYFVQQTGISSGVNTNEKLRAEFNFGNEEVISMVRAAEFAGVRVDFTKGQAINKVTAVDALFKCWKRLDREQFISMLQTIRTTWDGDPESYRREILNGMTAFYKAYWGQFTDKKLTSSLRNISPSTIVREGRSIGASAHAASSYARIILRAYNRNRTSGRLDDKL